MALLLFEVSILSQLAAESTVCSILSYQIPIVVLVSHAHSLAFFGPLLNYAPTLLHSALVGGRQQLIRLTLIGRSDRDASRGEDGKGFPRVVAEKSTPDAVDGDLRR